MSFPLDALTTVYMWFSFFGFVLSLLAATGVYAFNTIRTSVKAQKRYITLMIVPLMFLTISAALWAFRLTVS